LIDYPCWFIAELADLENAILPVSPLFAMPRSIDMAKKTRHFEYPPKPIQGAGIG